MMVAKVVSYNNYSGLSAMIDGVVYTVLFAGFKTPGTMINVTMVNASQRTVKLA